jgi:hydroxymethylpyrimidine pyrophosphatase-like HAD family hydrolase
MVRLLGRIVLGSQQEAAVRVSAANDWILYRAGPLTGNSRRRIVKSEEEIKLKIIEFDKEAKAAVEKALDAMWPNVSDSYEDIAHGYQSKAAALRWVLE